ncbi:MAG: AraC family transcriptional regulator [Rhodobacteraceae bacterium]|nr:AraC family transcriptional regulator [Paracoccaceae bacterium]
MTDTSADDTERALTILPISQIAAKGRWCTEEPHAEEAHLLIWFTKGQGRLMIEGKRMAFASNSIVFLPAGTPHAFEVKPGTFGTAVRITPHPTLELPTRPLLHRTRDLLLHSEFVSLFEAMQREAARPLDGASAKADRMHAGILGVWLERQPNHLKTAENQNASEKLAERYTKLLEERYASGTNVGALADELGVTPTHLTRVCQNAAGASAHQLLNQRIMYEARSLLTGTDRPVKRIAEGLGFSSAAYFTRAFLKTTGQTPSDFRRKSKPPARF